MTLSGAQRPSPVPSNNALRLCVALFVTTAAAVATVVKPNFVILFVDDLCFNEVRRLKVTARAFFDMVDTNHDNAIDVNEFISMVRRYHTMQKFVRSKKPSLWSRTSTSVDAAVNTAATGKPTSCCIIS